MDNKWEYLEVLISLVKLKLKGNASLELTNNDLTKLALILNFSTPTLQRLFSEKRKVYPSRFTRDKIAEYIGYRDFNDFIKKHIQKQANKTSENAIKIMFLFAQEDSIYADGIKKHLTPLLTNNEIIFLSSSDVIHTDNIKENLKRNIEIADIVLSIISPDYFADSTIIYLNEILYEERQVKNCIVIPIIAKASLWYSTWFGEIQHLPKGDRHISSFENPKIIYLEIARELSHLINNINSQKKKQNNRQLFIINKKLNSIPKEVFEKKKLEVLDLSQNYLTEIPDEIVLLEDLRVLILANNRIEKISRKITELKNLEYLNLEGNLIKDIHGQINFKQFAKLKDLYFQRNLIEFIDNSIIIETLNTLQINGNPIENIPKEIFDKEDNILDVIKDYFTELSKGQGKFYEAKLIIVGAGGAGKTTLTRKIKSPLSELPKPTETTKGIQIQSYRFPFLKSKSITYNANIWDFGGQEIYHSTHQFFLTKRSLYILVLDNRREDDDIDYWLSVIDLLSNRSPVVIVVNEKENRRRDISLPNLQTYYPNILNIFNTNLATNRGLKSLIIFLRKELCELEHIGTPLPEKWIDIRKRLESDVRDYISYEQYLDICTEMKIEEETQALSISRFLHDLGIILHFQEDEVLSTLVVLNPSWVTNAVYKVLDEPKVIRNKGKFDKSNLDKAWSSRKYSLTKRQQLLRFMKKFGLCYEIGESKVYISPQLLPIEKPTYDWQNLTEDKNQEELCFKYEYLFMPKGIVRRLMSQLNQYIYNKDGIDLIWKNGVVFHRKDGDKHTVAEVIENLFRGRKDITIKIVGSEKKEFLAILRDSLKTIHNSYRGNLQYKELIPCCCKECQEQVNSHFFDNEVLKRALSKGKQTIECQISFEDITIEALMNGVEAQYIRQKAIKVFFSYAREDKVYRDDLEKHLASLKRSSIIETWYDHEILAGQQWEKEILQNLNSADIVLLMVSSDFNYSKYCYEELKIALKRHQENQTKVIPIIVRSCDWLNTEFAKFNALPTSGKPIANWTLKDDAYLNIVEGLKKVLYI